MLEAAFVLGAGLGTRLRPLTARRPKPLIPVAGVPLISRAFDHILPLGARRLVVNTHWCAEAYAHEFPDGSYRSTPLIFTHEHPEVLETAGGIWHAREHLSGGTFLVYNGDILTDLPLAPALAAHRASGAEVTLVLRSHGGTRNVTFDPASGSVLDLRRELRPELEPRHSFTGIYFVEPSFIARIPAGEKISVVPIFHRMIRDGIRVAGHLADGGRWWDLGTREEYLAVHQALADEPLAAPHQPTGDAPWIHPSAEVALSAMVRGAAVVGPRARVAAHAVVEDSVLWEDCALTEWAKVRGCVVTAGAHVTGENFDSDL